MTIQVHDDDPPVTVDFVCPSSLLRQRDRPSVLTILGNGPPGTFVVFRDGLHVSLPTDQIVEADDRDGHVRVTFGGMKFRHADAGQLIFDRVRELRPETELSPARSHRMVLEQQRVSAVRSPRGLLWRGAVVE